MALGRRGEFETGCQVLATAVGRNYRKARSHHILQEPRLEPRLQTSLRSLRSEVGAEARKDLHPERGAAQQVFIGAWDRFGVHGRGNPKNGDRTDINAVEACSRDTNNRHGVLVDEELASDDVRGSAKLSLPEIVREDGERTSTGSSVIRLLNHAAQSGADAEDWEIASGNDFSCDRFRVATCREVHLDFGAAEDAVEELGLLLEVAAHWIGHEVPGSEPARDLIAFPVNKNKPSRIADRQRVQDHLINQRVKGGGRADAEGQREQRGGCEAGAPHEGPTREAEIIKEITEPAGKPDISNFFPHIGEPEFAGDAATGLGFGDAIGG